MTVLKQVLLKLWEGTALSGDDKIALLLLLAMVASLAHLMTMLVTRWGDRNIAVKSLLASLLVHSVCFLSLEVFEPISPVMASEPDYINLPQEVTTQILVESEDTISLQESGNTPVPDAATLPDVDLARLPVDSRSMTSPELPDPEIEVLDSFVPEVEDVTQFDPVDRPEQAMMVDNGTEGPLSVGALDPASEIETMLPQSSTDVYTPDTERVVQQRGGFDETSAEPEREMVQGSVQEIDDQIVTEDVSIVSATSDLENAVALPRELDADRTERRSAPINTADPLEEMGVTIQEPTRRTSIARSFDSRIPRPSRSAKNSDAGQRPVRRSDAMPRTPVPLATEYDEVRIGSSLSFTDSLRSAATMVDSDTQGVRRREANRATYKLRDLEQRREAAARFGGTRESEASVELSLRWLSSMQSPDGHWDAETHGAGQVKVDEFGVERNYAGRDSDSGLTALVALSFLGAGYTHEDGKYAVEVDRALAWLIRQQSDNGSLAGNSRKYAQMYCHAMATYALAEALGMQNEMITAPIIDPESLASAECLAQGIASSIMLGSGLPPFPLAASSNTGTFIRSERLGYSMRQVDDIQLRSALLRAVTFTISQQDPDSGGWRYLFDQEGDVSMFGWQMMSLKSAEIAGLDINPVVRRKMIGFLNSVRQGEDGGLFGYRRSSNVPGHLPEPVSEVMTAEALFCQQMLGYRRDSAANREAVQHLLDHPPRIAEFNNYYWYYGTLAMYQYGGEEWKRWNNIVRDSLISLQRKDGEFAGSWDPKGPWGRYGGRLYSTALSTLTLEVYYRLLPLYRMNDVTSAD